MVKLLPEIDKDNLKFYSKGYITHLGFYIKALHSKGYARFRDIGNFTLRIL